jgi:hypothetical protein
MEELAKVIAAKSGISEEQATSAAQAAMDFIKSKLPEPMAAQLEAALSGGGASSMLGKVGGLFG